MEKSSFDLVLWIFQLLLIFREVSPNCLPGYSSYEGDCYGGPQDALYTWDQSEQYCTTLGGHLTSVTSYAQHNFILGLISRYKQSNPELWNEVWIGLYHTNPVTYQSDYNTKRQGWQWSDGENYNYYAWDPLDPSNNERYARISHGVWLGSLHGNMHNNLICKISVNSFKVEVPQPYPPAPTRGWIPVRSTLPPHLRSPRVRTTRYAPYPTLAPYPTFAPYPTVAPYPTFAPYPTDAPYPTFAPSPQPTKFQFIPRATTEKSTIFQVITPTTSKDNQKNRNTDDERNSVNTDSNEKNGSPEKRLQDDETSSTSGLSRKLIPVAAVVPAVAIVMIVILVGVLYARKRSSKSNMYDDSETKSYNQNLHMTPMSTMRDPTNSQYYNETYRSLSSLFRKAQQKPTYGLTPPIYGNTSMSGTSTSTLSTVRSCYQNDYMG